MDNEILKTLRYMAWERARGELNGMLQTYWDHNDDSKYRRLEEVIRNLENEVIGHGLHE